MAIDVGSYNAAISACALGQLLELAHALFAEVPARWPDVTSYNAAISAYGKAKR